MNSLISAEMYKLKKAGAYKYSLISSMLPILFFIYILQGKLTLIETGYSMNQWCAVLLFQLSEQFLIPAILLSMIYDAVFKEKDIAYKDMLTVRKNEFKLLISKLIPSGIYSMMLILVTISVISLTYTLASSHTSYFTGKIINNSNKAEWMAFQLNVLFVIAYGIFLPSISIILSSYLSTKLTIIQVIIGLLVSRLSSQIETFSRYTIWFYLKQAKYIINIENLELLWKPYISMLIILIIVSTIALRKGRNKLILYEGDKND